MIQTWYGIVSLTLLMFVVLEGFDIGAGMLQYVVGKDESERRMVISAIGPLWSWHEVWLVAFGGTLLLAFPTIMAASFSGFYMALFLVLWCFVVRGVSLEISGHITDPMWRTAWHFGFICSSVLLAVLIGVALGNIVRGVPIDANGKFCMALFTHFRTTGNVGLLDWYTLSMAIFISFVFAAHGASGLAKRTTRAVRARSMLWANRLWKVVVVGLAVMVFETSLVRGDFFPQLLGGPLGCLGILCIVGGICTIFVGLRRDRESEVLAGSIASVAGIMITGAIGVFPLMLRSTIAPEYSLSAYHSAAEGRGLEIALVWWPIAFCLAVGYFAFIYRHYSGKVDPLEDTQKSY